jgi:hypothetical protein
MDFVLWSKCLFCLILASYEQFCETCDQPSNPVSRSIEIQGSRQVLGPLFMSICSLSNIQNSTSHATISHHISQVYDKSVPSAQDLIRDLCLPLTSTFI